MFCSSWSWLWPKLVFHPVGALTGYIGYKIGRACCPNMNYGGETRTGYDSYGRYEVRGPATHSDNICYSVIFAAITYVMGQCFTSMLLNDPMLHYVARAWQFSCDKSNTNSTNTNSTRNLDANNTTDSSISNDYEYYTQNSSQDLLHDNNSTELL